MSRSLFLQAVVQLSFRCELFRTDEKSDFPTEVRVRVFDITNAREAAIGETEALSTLKPLVFSKTVDVNYFFEMKQSFTLQVWAKRVSRCSSSSSSSGGTGGPSDGKGEVGEEQEYEYGSGVTTLAAILCAQQSTLTLRLDAAGTILVCAHGREAVKGSASLLLSGHNLKKMHFFSKSDPYIVIRHLQHCGHKKQVYKTEVVHNTLNPVWRATPQMDLTTLCGGDWNARCIAFDCYDKDVFSDDAMGGFVLSMKEIAQSKGKDLELLKVSSKTPDKPKSYGFVRIDECHVLQKRDFVSCLRQGLRLSLCFSIDFTESNEPPSCASSLHYCGQELPNNYVRSMRAVADVVQDYYAGASMITAYGFGAIPPGMSEASHLFPLNLHTQSPHMDGLDALLLTYESLLPSLRFAGPTNVAPTISTVSRQAREVKDTYTILVVLTDGAITDMQDTIDAVVAADDAPLSIVIVGIGEEDFKPMERLEEAFEPLTSRAGHTARRRVVSFVPFSRYSGKRPEILAAAMLRSVPEQLEAWDVMMNNAAAATATTSA